MMSGCGHVGSRPVRHACSARPRVEVTKAVASAKGVSESVRGMPRTRMLRALLALCSYSAMVAETAALGARLATSTHLVVSAIAVWMVAICSSTSGVVRGAAVTIAVRETTS